MGKSPEELRNAFWQEDAERGGVIRQQYDEIKRVLEKRDMDWVLEQFRSIKQFAMEHTDYYRDGNFSVVDKTSILEHYAAHQARDGYDLPIHISSTSGSTGTPFAVSQNYRKRMRNIADLKVFGELCDYPSHERMVFFRVLNDKLHRTKEQEERENIYYIDSSDLSDHHLHEMMVALLDLRPRIVFSYASTLVELAKYIRKIGVDAARFSMQSVLSGGEGLSNADRVLLSQTFGCKVYRRYSDMEMGILGQDDGDGGFYFLNWGSYYFECLKEDSDEPTCSGEVGRIVVTDLFNRAFPLIRYDTGDLGIMERPNDGTFPVLKEIYGRKRDCIYATDGRLISPAKISVSMWGATGVKQWQFIQETQTGYTLKLNADSNVEAEMVLQKLKQVVGQDANICVEFVREIPVTSSNKRRAVICHYRKEN